MVKIESEFDLEHVIKASRITGKRARVLLKITPNIDPTVNSRLSSDLAMSKIGIQNSQIQGFLKRLRNCTNFVELLGINCYIGQNIKDVSVLRDAVIHMY